jgi:hypothetical protein
MVRGSIPRGCADYITSAYPNRDPALNNRLWQLIALEDLPERIWVTEGMYGVPKSKHVRREEVHKVTSSLIRISANTRRSNGMIIYFIKNMTWPGQPNYWAALHHQIGKKLVSAYKRLRSPQSLQSSQLLWAISQPLTITCLRVWVSRYPGLLWTLPRLAMQTMAYPPFWACTIWDTSRQQLSWWYQVFLYW